MKKKTTKKMGTAYEGGDPWSAIEQPKKMTKKKSKMANKKAGKKKSFTKGALGFLCLALLSGNAFALDRFAAITLAASPNLSTSAHTANAQIGTVITLSTVTLDTGGFVSLDGLTIIDKSAQNSAMDILFFSQVPSLNNLTNARPVITSVTDHILGVVGVAANEYHDAGVGLSVATKSTVSVVLHAAKGQKTIYALPISRGAPTYSGSNDLLFKFRFRQL